MPLPLAQLSLLRRPLALPPQPPQAVEEMSGGEPRGCSSSSSSSSYLAASAAATVELLDEYWYSRNVLSERLVELGVLARSLAGGNGSGVPSCSGATGKESLAADAARSSAGEAPQVGGKTPLRRSLLRAPSLPPPCVGGEKPAQERACPRRSGGGKLRHSYSNLEGVLLLSSGSSRQHLSSSSSKSADRHQPPRHAKVESIIRYVDGHHRAITGESRRRAFQVKKWRSLSDLETEEVQGLRDLGFVFDGGSVTPGVLEVVPGLRRGELEGTKAVRRPYLSEAWLVQRSAPPALDWVGGGSAADVKEQLRFWAQVVASNVRQER
ncbi:hypothetical protein Taro_036592 [Colocasia esculenta]|uniref:Uncharacterized protein n=1 Tax=Colocasia esculenta TaxID=4460 RepID=A0A843WGR9_COLES|nr:hypothetical protein [Colocasia esculenta]